jgi:hypothetical protein
MEEVWERVCDKTHLRPIKGDRDQIDDDEVAILDEEDRFFIISPIKDDRYIPVPIMVTAPFPDKIRGSDVIGNGNRAMARVLDLLSI